MRMARLLANPGIAEVAGEDLRVSLSAATALLGDAHPLARSLRRASEPVHGSSVRSVRLAPGVRLLDLGGSEKAGLLLGLPAGPADLASRAVWIVWGLSLPSVNLFLVPLLRGLSSDLHRGKTREEIARLLSSQAFAEKRVRTEAVVEDALTPLSYRVYADTPAAEVQHLMLRRKLSAVPVVGGSRELLGVITPGDMLSRVLSRQKRGASAGGGLAARDVMNRSVLCVAPDESLAEAGLSMVERNIAQLPVVREGELIGLLERSSVLRAFSEAVVAEEGTA